MFRFSIELSRFNPFKASEKASEKTGTLFGRFVSFITSPFRSAVPETVVKTHVVAAKQVKFGSTHFTTYKPEDSPNDLRKTDMEIKLSSRASLLSPPKDKRLPRGTSLQEITRREKAQDAKALNRASQIRRPT